MTLWQSYGAAIVRFAVWQGRSSRTQFFGYLAVVALMLVLAAIGDRILVRDARFNLLLGITIAFHGIPTLSICVRRLHDVDFPAPVLLVGAIPYIGWFLLGLLAISPSTPTPGRYDAPGSTNQPLATPPRFDLSGLGRRARRGLQRLKGGARSSAWAPVQSLPAPPDWLAKELGVDRAKAGAGPKDSASRRQQLDAMLRDGLLSEAEFIKLTKESK